MKELSDPSCEKSLLGLLIIEPAYIDSTPGLKEEWFYDKRNRHLFKVLQKLYWEHGVVEYGLLLIELGGEWSEADLKGYLSLERMVLDPKPLAQRLGSFYQRRSAITILNRASERISAEFKIPDDFVGGITSSLEEVFSGSEAFDVLVGSESALDRLEVDIESGNIANRNLATGIQSIDKSLSIYPGGLFVIASRPAVGKCLTGDGRVWQPMSNKYTRIDELYNLANGDFTPNKVFEFKNPADVLSVAPDGATIIDFATRIAYIGERRIVALSTRSGKFIKATENHYFMTPEGWKQLGELSPGSVVAIAHSQPVSKRVEPSENMHKVEDLSSEGKISAWWDAQEKARGYTSANLFIRAMATFCPGPAITEKGKDSNAVFSINSRRIAEDLQNVALSLGISLQISHQGNEFLLMPSVRQDAINLVPFFETRYRGRFTWMAQRLPSPKPAHGYSWDFVESIKQSGVTKVYDIQVPFSENLAVNQVICHNSSLAEVISENVASRGLPVLHASLEMSPREITIRRVARETGIDISKLARGELNSLEIAKFKEAKAKLSTRPLFVMDNAGADLNAFELSVRSLANRGLKPALIVVDYLQLMVSESQRLNQNTVQAVAAVSRGLKVMARRWEIPIIALSQLSRAIESRPGGKPVLSDLRDSGAVEQDADAVAFLQRDGYYENKDLLAGEAELIIAKQRNGPTGSVKLWFIPSIAKFGDKPAGASQFPTMEIRKLPPLQGD